MAQKAAKPIEWGSVRALLLRGGKELPHADRATILARGESAIPELLEIVEDEETWFSTAQGGGWAPAHAIEILGELHAEQAIAPMLDVLARTEWQDLLHDYAILGLQAIGAPAFVPTWSRLKKTRHPDLRETLLSILSELGVRDERLYEKLVKQFEESSDICMAASNLASYGDDRALPVLSKALDAEPISHDPSPTANMTIIELADAIECLGGTFTESQQAKLQEAQRLAQAMRGLLRAALPARREAKPGRNEPCWCGSGTKYKKCHLDRDSAS